MNQQTARIAGTARGLARTTAFLFALLSFARVMAAGAPPVLPPVQQTPESVAQGTIDDALAPILAVRGATATVRVAPPDPRRAQAPCEQLIGFLPPGVRLTGRTVVGVKCADGSNWQVFVSAVVRVEGATWQATRALRAGEPLAAGDLALAPAVLNSNDLDAAAGMARSGAAQSAASLPSLASIDGRFPAPIGRVLQRPVAQGRALTASDVRDEGRVKPGDPVRIVYRGDGFSVSSEGHAVGAGDPGTTVSIRLASGALVNGLLKADHLVELPR